MILVQLKLDLSSEIAHTIRVNQLTKFENEENIRPFLLEIHMIDESSSQWLCSKPIIENGNTTENVFHTSTEVRCSRKAFTQL